MIKWITILLLIAIPVAAQEYSPRTYWLIGDSHVLQGAGLAVGLNNRIVNNGDKFKHEAKVGAKIKTFSNFIDENYVRPDDTIIISLGINSSKMPLEEAKKQTKEFVNSLGNRNCYWILPPVKTGKETPGYWKMMKESVKPCLVFDTSNKLKISKHNIMGKFHLKISYAKRVWAEKVWNFIQNGEENDREKETIGFN